MPKGSKVFGGGQSGMRQATTFYNKLQAQDAFFRMRPVYDINVVVNGGFDTDTGWVKGPGWTISGGLANYDGSPVPSALTQDTLVDGQKYTATVSVNVITQGGVRIGNGTTYQSRESVGTITVDFTASGTKLTVEAIADGSSNAFIGKIDNVVCRRRQI